MAKNQEIEFSTSAALNTDAGGTNIDEGCPPGTLNNAIRFNMKARADAITRHVVKAAGTYTPAKADHNQFWRCTGAVTLNLTAAATLTDGWALWVRANGGAVTIDPSGAELIDGAATLVLADGQQALIICTGTAFFTLFNTTPVGVTSGLKADGRLTLETGAPISFNDVTTAGTIYYTPYVGNVISLYTGSIWIHRVFAEISLALTATSGKPYDVFVYDNAGVAALETLVWTNDGARATALVRQDGVWCKSGDLTRRYVGSFYASAANQCEDSRKKRYIWNMYNRVSRSLATSAEAAASWTYTTDTWRQANANAANQVDFILGLNEDIVSMILISAASNSLAATIVYSAIGQDGVAAPAIDCSPGIGREAATNAYMEMTSTFSGLIAFGKHSLVWLERSAATGTTTWLGTTASLVIPGLRGSIFA